MENHQAVTTLRPFYMSGVSRSLRMCVALMWLIVSSSLSAQISPIVISEVFYDSPLNECSYPEEKIIPMGSSPHTTTYGYDALCRYREREINYRGQLSQVQYDYGSGRVMEETDIYGMTTSYQYDAYGRLSRKRLPNASTTTYSISKDNSHGAYYKKQSLEESTHRIDLL